MKKINMAKNIQPFRYNNNGITLTILIVTIIIIGILGSISIKASRDYILESREQEMRKNLAIILQEYNLIKEKAEVSENESNFEEQLRKFNVNLSVKTGSFKTVGGFNETSKYLTVDDLEKLKVQLHMVENENKARINVLPKYKKEICVGVGNFKMYLDSKDNIGKRYIIKGKDGYSRQTSIKFEDI